MQILNVLLRVCISWRLAWLGILQSTAWRIVTTWSTCYLGDEPRKRTLPLQLGHFSWLSVITMGLQPPENNILNGAPTFVNCCIKTIFVPNFTSQLPLKKNKIDNTARKNQLLTFLRRTRGKLVINAGFCVKRCQKIEILDQFECKIDAFRGCKLVFWQSMFLFFSWRPPRPQRKKKKNKGSPPRPRKKNSKKKNKKKSSKDDEDERVPFLVPLVIMPGVKDGKPLFKTGILQNNNKIFRMRTRVSRTATRSCHEQVFKNWPKIYKNQKQIFLLSEWFIFSHNRFVKSKASLEKVEIRKASDTERDRQ